MGTGVNRVLHGGSFVIMLTVPYLKVSGIEPYWQGFPSIWKIFLLIGRFPKNFKSSS